MRIKISGVLLIFLTLNLGCAKKPGLDDAASNGDGAGSTSKPTRSLWSVSNSTWAIDLRPANLAGNPFSGQIIFADSSVTTCTLRLQAGASEISGTYSASGCTKDSFGMSLGSVAAWYETGGTGLYVNSGTKLMLCTQAGNCTEYQ